MFHQTQRSCNNICPLWFGISDLRYFFLKIFFLLSENKLVYKSIASYKVRSNRRLRYSSTATKHLISMSCKCVKKVGKTTLNYVKDVAAEEQTLCFEQLILQEALPSCPGGDVRIIQVKYTRHTKHKCRVVFSKSHEVPR